MFGGKANRVVFNQLMFIVGKPFFFTRDLLCHCTSVITTFIFKGLKGLQRVKFSTNANGKKSRFKDH